MLTTEQRNEIADDITAAVVRRVRVQVDEAQAQQRTEPAHRYEPRDRDILAIERQVAVQLLTGLRSAPLETDTPGQYDARALYGAVLALLDQSSVDTDNQGQVLFYSGLVESDERHSNGQPRYLRDQA